MNRKKILYIPGIFTLFGIPLLFCFFFYPVKNPERMTSIVFVGKYEKHDGYCVKFDTTFLSSSFGKRKYLQIKLNSDNLKPKLDSIRGLSRYLYKFHDTINGIHIVFDKDCKFETFIQVFNNLKKDSVAVIAPFENNVWVFYNLGNEVRLRERLKEQVEEKPYNRRYWFDKSDYSEAKLVDFLLQKWPIPLMFCLLLGLSIHRLIVRFKNGKISSGFHFLNRSKHKL